MADASEFQWSEDGFCFRGERFYSDTSWRNRRETSPQGFTIVKNRAHIEAYLAHLNRKYRQILEVGFFEGGSSVFLNLFYRPETLVSVDRRAKPIPEVDTYAINTGSMQMVYGFDQGDGRALHHLCDQSFPNGLDLVIDDASHQYELTKTTFSHVFPRVVPGGTYVIEDWGWAHAPYFQTENHPWFSEPALSNLVFRLLMISVKNRELIQSIQVTSGLCIITKGSAKLDESPLDIDGLYLSRGKTLNLI